MDITSTLRLWHSVNMTVCTGKLKSSRGSLCCDIHFIAVVWSQTCSVPKACSCGKLDWIGSMLRDSQGVYRVLVMRCT